MARVGAASRWTKTTGEAAAGGGPRCKTAPISTDPAAKSLGNSSSEAPTGNRGRRAGAAVPRCGCYCSPMLTDDVSVLTADPARRVPAQATQERLDSYEPPILTLPNEITMEIFIHFLPIYPLCPPLIDLLSPTLLTHICRRWREIALGTPELWRAIKFFTNSRIPLQRKVNIAGLWLRRSHCSPLSIFIDEFGRRRKDLGEVFTAILPHRARWEYLRFDLMSCFPVIEGPMPLLRHLDLALGNKGDEDPAVFHAFRELPSLRTAILYERAAANIILPWAQLTSLTLMGVSTRECVPILQKTPNLEHCQLGLGDGNGDPPDIVLPRLRALVLQQEYLSVTNYLRTIIAPALRNLEIPESFLGSKPIDALASFITKSGCELQEVHITGQRLIGRDTYCAAFPSIQQFSFQSHWWGDGMPE
ncbi:hypothetical protein B0H13DRAFT_1893420 [Mycena leptocephala]|nr:hypothetical protein B0H13DRAFT_1893420 [Mycena leptocephala]